MNLELDLICPNDDFAVQAEYDKFAADLAAEFKCTTKLEIPLGKNCGDGSPRYIFTGERRNLALMLLEFYTDGCKAEEADLETVYEDMRWALLKDSGIENPNTIERKVEVIHCPVCLQEIGALGVAHGFMGATSSSPCPFKLEQTRESINKWLLSGGVEIMNSYRHGDITRESGMAALKEAGLDPAEIDTVIRKGHYAKFI